jgi:hypothetical protein
MEIAFQQRRQQILGDCRQLKTDVDSYNDNYNSGSAAPICKWYLTSPMIWQKTNS